MPKFKNTPGRAIGVEGWRQAHQERLQNLRSAETVAPMEKMEKTEAEKSPEVQARPAESSLQPKQPEPPQGQPQPQLATGLTEEELETGLRQKIHSAVRWLAEWVVRQVQLKEDPGVVVLEIRVPKENEIEIAAAEQFYANCSR